MSPSTLVDRCPLGENATEWPLWSTTARMIVTDPDALPVARALVAAQLYAVEIACSRFRPDAEIRRLDGAAGQPVAVSPLLAELVAAALVAAEATDGDVDPTIGGALDELGYGRDVSRISDGSDLEVLRDGVPQRIRVRLRPATGWRRVRLDGRLLSVPAGTTLDLGATAKAFAADRCAELVARRCGVGALVSLGGDIATAGPAPDGGWSVLVQDRPGEPAETVRLPAGAGLATSSTIGRAWRRGDAAVHHIVDPWTGRSAGETWRTASVAADSCLLANTYSTAAIVRGHSARSWLARLERPARLVAPDGDVVRVGGWPPATERVA